MVYLTTNTANQTVRLTLDEGRAYFDTAFTHYLVIITREEHSAAGEDLAQVATVVNETYRVTRLTITTVGLTMPGRYRYEVYGQNSANNTNPNNVSVVGLVERGTAQLTDSTQYYDTPSLTISDDVIYEG